MLEVGVGIEPESARPTSSQSPSAAPTGNIESDEINEISPVCNEKLHRNSGSPGSSVWERSFLWAMLEELQLEEAAEAPDAAAAPAPSPAPAPTPGPEAPEAAPQHPTTPAPTTPLIPGISSLAGNREGSWQRGEKRKREEDREGPVEQRA